MSSVQAIERALLTGEWSSQDNGRVSEAIVSSAKSVVDGSFREHITSPQVRSLFTLSPDIDSSKPMKTWFPLLFLGSDEAHTEEREVLLLVTAVACLHGFLQANWTGPDIDITPRDTVNVPAPIHDLVTEEFLQAKAISELAYGGEPAYHLAESAFFLRFAQIILQAPFQCLETIHWWRIRAWNIHQQVLDEPVAVPLETLLPLDSLAATLSSHPDLVGQLWLERGLLEHYQGNDKVSAEYFVKAARATGLQYELTGALGKRTKFQQTELSQLVLLAESRVREDQADRSKKPNDDADGSQTTMPETLSLNDDTLLEQTEFTSSHPAAPGSRLAHLDPSAQPSLYPLDQCIFLGLCLNVRNTSPQHGLTNEQMSPYIARVISHPRNWSVHTMALLLRSRLESNRTRTVERAVLQLQALVDQMPTSDSTIPERLAYIHSLPLPSKWQLQRELAARFLSIGVVKSALEIFERLEMWEDAVKCYQATERRDTARALVLDLLEGRKAEADTVLSRGKMAMSDTRRTQLDAAREAKLWCLLGELEPENAVAHFEKAWAVSKGTSARAMRSLGGYYFTREHYADAVRCLRRAVAISPLLHRSWFILGCAYVRLENWDGAREAFSRCVAIDEEDGESWNNLASVYLRMQNVVMQKGQSARDDDDDEVSVKTVDHDTTSRIPFENKTLAFRALQQGLKSSYENWRMWANYMIVAMDVGELAEAAHALGRIVEERAAKIGAKAVDEEVLDRLVDAVTRAQPDERVPETGAGLLRRVTDLFERIILPRVSSPRIFRARARLLTFQGKLEDAINAHLDAYRAGIAHTITNSETDVERWREGAGEVRETVDVLRNFGPKVDGFKWRVQARSILRTFMGRSREFRDEKEWEVLEGLMEELKSSDE